MSAIRDLVKTRVNELAFKDLSEHEDVNEYKTVTLRLTHEVVAKLDVAAKKLEFSRSELIRSILEAGINEVLQELKVTHQEIWGGAKK